MNRQQTFQYNQLIELSIMAMNRAQLNKFDQRNRTWLAESVQALKDARAIRDIDCMGCGKEDANAKPGNPWLCTPCITGPHLDGEAGTLQQDYLDRHRD